MTRIYLKYEHCISSKYSEFNASMYSKWQLTEPVRKWLDDNSSNWRFDSSESYSWEIFHDGIEEEMHRVLTLNIATADYERVPFDKCKPYIEFKSDSDAILFKLTFF